MARWGRKRSFQLGLVVAILSAGNLATTQAVVTGAYRAVVYIKENMKLDKAEAKFTLDQRDPMKPTLRVQVDECLAPQAFQGGDVAGEIRGILLHEMTHMRLGPDVSCGGFSHAWTGPRIARSSACMIETIQRRAWSPTRCPW